MRITKDLIKPYKICSYLIMKICYFNWKMAKWLIDYNTILTHTSLEYKTPAEYAIVKEKKCHMLRMRTFICGFL